MDLSLIELNRGIDSIHEVTGIGIISGYCKKDDLQEGTMVELHGRTTGYKKLKLGDAIVVKRIKYKGQNYCFKDLVQVKAVTLRNLILHRPVSGGDSGAWICAQGASGTEWAGMIIAEDRLSGYAICSEDILSWLNGQGYKLECC